LHAGGLWRLGACLGASLVQAGAKLLSRAQQAETALYFAALLAKKPSLLLTALARPNSR